MSLNRPEAEEGRFCLTLLGNTSSDKFVGMRRFRIVLRPRSITPASQTLKLGKRCSTMHTEHRHGG